MFLGIPQINKFLGAIKISRLDDFIDRCNYYYTVLLLLFFTLLIGTKQYFGEPIRCFVDQSYPGSWINYVHDYCFITERYSLTPPDFLDDFASQFSDGTKYYESYYQWTPFFLFLQALSFRVPHFLWKSLQKFRSLDFEIVVEEAVKIHSFFGENRKKALKNLAKYIEQFLNFSGTSSCSFGCIRFGRFCSASSFLYLFSKFLNVVNIVIQLLMMNAFIGNGNLFWGLELFHELVSGHDWSKTGQFPRVVYCDFEKVEMANVERKTVQCTLTINILNEKVFLLLTFWFLLLLFCTISNVMYCFLTTFVPPLREREATAYLTNSLTFDDEDSASNDGCDYFVDGDGRPGQFMESGCVIDPPSHARLHFRCISGDNNSCRHRIISQSSELDQLENTLSKSERKRTMCRFMRHVLGVDGIQLLHFVRTHAGAMTARDLTQVLWEDFLKAKESQNRLCEQLQQWRKPVSNPMFKDPSNKAAPTVQTKLSDCYKSEDGVNVQPSAPCLPGSAASTSGISIYETGCTRDYVDAETVKEESVGSWSLKHMKPARNNN